MPDKKNRLCGSLKKIVQNRKKKKMPTHYKHWGEAYGVFFFFSLAESDEICETRGRRM